MTDEGKALLKLFVFCCWIIFMSLMVFWADQELCPPTIYYDSCATTFLRDDNRIPNWHDDRNIQGYPPWYWRYSVPLYPR